MSTHKETQPPCMPASIASAREYFDLLASTVHVLDSREVDEIAAQLYSAYLEDRTVFIFGNGGSAALASHLACDLGKGTTNLVRNAKRFRVIALTDNVAMLTAWANDYGYEYVFSEQLANLVQAGDIAFAISGSGNSLNVLNALETARQAGATTIGVSGFNGGKMKALCQTLLVVPSTNMQIIEDLHLSIAHAIFTIVAGKISSSSRVAAAAATS